ncbi:MAG: cytochrome c [Proteobacteria bacterium]|nr:cytochrome c [Pseudomonadota bacterium]
MNGPFGRAAWPLLLAGWALAAGVARADDQPRYPDGAATFQANCAVCHRANGAGTPGLAPPLTEYPARFAGIAEGRRQLAMTVLYGMFGDIVIGERHYNFKMPDFGRFDDATLAAALNFVVFDIGHAPAATAPLAAADIAAERVHELDGSAVREHRATVVAGLPP